MEIKPTPQDSRPAGLEFDLTKRVRESIQARQPLTPKAEASADAGANSGAEADAVAKAREQYREQRRERVHNARLHYTANQNEQHAAEVRAARDEYRAGLEKRKQNVADAKAQGGTDKIEISGKLAKLASDIEALARTGDTERAARIEALREQYLEGRPDGEARIARSAEKLLGGE